MRYLLVLCILLSFSSLQAEENTLSATPYNFAKVSIGRGKPVFFELGSKNCPGCVKMGKTLYTIKKNNPQYTIKYIDIYANKKVIEKYNISAIPMQVIYDNKGNEVYRNMGVLNERELAKVFKEYEF